MQTITKASVIEAGQSLRCNLVAYCTTTKLATQQEVRDLVAKHDLITGQLTVAKAKAIIEFCEAEGYMLGGWLEALICWAEDWAEVNPADLPTLAVKFLGRQAYIRELAQLLQIGTDLNGALVFSNEAKAEAFFDQLAQYDADQK